MVCSSITRRQQCFIVYSGDCFGFRIVNCCSNRTVMTTGLMLRMDEVDTLLMYYGYIFNFFDNPHLKVSIFANVSDMVLHIEC